MEELKDELQDTLQPDEEVQDSENDEPTDESTDEKSDEESLDLEKKNKQLFERAKKAETDLKELRAKLNQHKQEESTNSSLTEEAVEEKIFIANGGSEDELNMLKSIRDVKHVGLFEAKKDPLYILWKEKEDKEAKEKEASLRASQARSKQKEAEKPLNKDEHKELVRKRAEEIRRKQFGG